MEFQMPHVNVPSFPEYRVDIRDFGAVSDGVTMNTKAINDAIEACHNAGGGTVYIPAGFWKTAGIQLKSGVRLDTAAGAFIKFSDDYREYPLIHSHFEGLPTARCISPIYAVNAENIAITGEGIFDGAGESWRVCKKWKFTGRQWEALCSKAGAYYVENGEESLIYPSEAAYLGSLYNKQHGGMVTDLEEAKAYQQFFRPVMVNLVGCKNVLLQGISFQNSPAWCLHPRMCDHLTMDRVSMRNPWYAQNGDALDLEACQYVEIRHCSFDAGDDGICVKSGKNKPGRETERPTANVWIHDCVVYHGHGGFVIGSEMSCGVENVLVEDCTFIGTDVGLRFKSCLGRGGLVRNIRIRNIRMDDIKEQALIMSMGYGSAIGSEKDVEKQYPREDVPEFCHIHMSDIVCSGARQAVEICGLAQQPVHDITLERAVIRADKGVQCRYAENICLKDVTIASSQTPDNVLRFADETVGDGYRSAF